MWGLPELSKAIEVSSTKFSAESTREIDQPDAGARNNILPIAYPITTKANINHAYLFQKISKRETLAVSSLDERVNIRANIPMTVGTAQIEPIKTTLHALRLCAEIPA